MSVQARESYSRRRKIVNKKSVGVKNSFVVNPSEIDEEEDLKLRELGHQLAEILVFPWRKNNLIYIEDNPDDEFMTKYEGVVDEDFKNAPDKKSRYYRKYPWKRQNARQT